MSEFLNLLKESYGEDVSNVEAILKDKNQKIDTIIQEAFKDDFANKSTAIYRIKHEFVDSVLAPKTIDIAFLKENIDSIVNKVNSLDEGEIKIIINNDVNKAGRTPIVAPSPCSVSTDDDDEDLEMECDNPKKKGMKGMKETKSMKKVKKAKKEEKEVVEEKTDAKNDNVIDITIDGKIVKVNAGADTGLEGTEQEFESETLAKDYAESLRKFFSNQKDMVVNVSGGEEETPEEDVPEETEETPEEVEPVEDVPEETPEETEDKKEVEEAKEVTNDEHEASETPEEEKAEHENGEEAPDEESDISWDDIEDFTSDEDSKESDESEEESEEESDDEKKKNSEESDEDEEDEVKAESVSKKYVGKLIKASNSWYMVESISEEGLVCKDKSGESKIVNVTDVQIVEEYEDENEEETEEETDENGEEIEVDIVATDNVPSDEIVNDEESEEETEGESEESEEESEEKKEEEEEEEEAEEKEVDESEKINDPEYKYWVVIKTANGDNKIETGWSYREDAQDQVLEVPAEKEPKVYALAGLKKFNLDPNDNASWATGDDVMKKESVDYSGIESYLE